MFESVIGLSDGWHKIEYTWRDMALYALAVGADEEDLMFTWEAQMKAIPSFGVIPYWNNINHTPHLPKPSPGAVQAVLPMSREVGYQLTNHFHMAHEIICCRPIECIKGSLIFRDQITNIYDRGAGKGGVIETEMPVFDEAGNQLCHNRSYTLMASDTPGKAFGGWGGTPFVSHKAEFPDREPDYVAHNYMNKVANVLYRLTGDTGRGHIDRVRANYLNPNGRGVFMMGLAPYGYACLMLCKTLLPGEPERMRRMYAQMRNTSYPDTHLELRAWKTGGSKVSFRLMDMEADRPILENGEFEWG